MQLEKNNEMIFIDSLDNNEMGSNLLSKFDEEEEPDNPPVVDQEELRVVYDPVLNCYYDPQTQQYYELNINS